MPDLSAAVRAAVKELFAAGTVSLAVGFERGSLGYRSRPAIISTAAEAERLTWDATCSNNLAAYLPVLFQRPPQRKGAETPLPRIAFVVKGCDMRSIVALIKERQAPRENLVLIGVPCRGMIDEDKLQAAAAAALGGEEGGAPRAVAPAVEIAAISENGNAIAVVTTDGRSASLPREPLVQEACLACRFPSPQGADVLLEGASRPACADGDEVVRAMEKLSQTERWQGFSREISRCIRCYACRQACPTCYCKECFAETNAPAWIGASTSLSDLMIFHLIRIFHQAGRCVECDACVRACPMGIDLRPWTKKIAADVRELFGFTPDFDPSAPPPLCAFREDDGQGFITEPRKG